MLKPASSACNMRCAYCFYHSLAASRAVPDKGMMTEETLDAALRGAFEYADGGCVSLSFQGGEPLLRGKEFFRTVERLTSELNGRGSPLFVAVQTNGTLIDDEWCEIFARNKWLVGLSLDGDSDVNDLRVLRDGTPAFSVVTEAAERLRRHGVEFNVLCVVTEKVAKNAEKVYTFFTRKGFRHLQFIPVLMPQSGYYGQKGAGYNAPSTVLYASFYRKIFALYLADMRAGRYTSVRQFDNLARLARGDVADQCGMCGGCSQQFVVEGNGDVYPCDFYCTDEWLLGNVNSDGFAQMADSARGRAFLADSAGNSAKCRACKWKTLCGGGCKRENADFDRCKVFGELLKEITPHLKRMS